jgi:pleckstrin family protein A (phosphoinositide binding specific) protein 8
MFVLVLKKIRQKYTLDAAKYHTLQAIVQDEIDQKQTNVRNSATDALMWLRRAVWFLREFMYNFVTAQYEPDINECVYVSYQYTLRQYHNWVVRSIFSLAMRSLPSKEDFLKGMAINAKDYLNNKREFHMQVVFQMRVVIEGIDRAINAIKDFYEANNLEV